jgi:FlaG/FlaF family flagellin (archaellin)
VLATVLLIAVTLIAVVAIAGFVFGLFGSFTSIARVQASVTSCRLNGAAPFHEYCLIILTNTGNSNTIAIGACDLTFGGYTVSGYSGSTLAQAVPPGTSATISADGSTVVYCQAGRGSGAGAGVEITGSVVMANGGDAMFTATAST